MKKFWSYIKNDEYAVGCTGQTVWLFDSEGNVLSKFKDLPYAYLPVISPDGNILAVKTTDGRMAVYSLSERKLIEKFRYSKVDGAQHDNFCFSPDSELIYNIERYPDDLTSRLSVYQTSDFSLVEHLLDDDKKTVLETIEYDNALKKYFLLGFERNKEGIAYKFFVSYLDGKSLGKRKYIPEKVCEFYREYISLKNFGFTEEAYRWSYFGDKEFPTGGKQKTLEELKEESYSLSELYSSCL